MSIIKIKVSEPRIIATAIRHPFQMVLSFVGNSTDVVTAIIDGDYFIHEDNDYISVQKVVDVLVKNKINFELEFKN